MEHVQEALDRSQLHIRVLEEMRIYARSWAEATATYANALIGLSRSSEARFTLLKQPNCDSPLVQAYGETLAVCKYNAAIFLKAQAEVTSFATSMHDFTVEAEKTRSHFVKQKAAIETEYKKLIDEVESFGKYYKETSQKVDLRRIKLHDRTQNTTTEKFERHKSKLLQEVENLQNGHNDYVLALQTATAHDQVYKSRLTPRLLEVTTEADNSLASNVKVFLLKMIKAVDMSTFADKTRLALCVLSLESVKTEMIPDTTKDSKETLVLALDPSLPLAASHLALGMQASNATPPSTPSSARRREPSPFSPLINQSSTEEATTPVPRPRPSGSVTSPLSPTPAPRKPVSMDENGASDNLTTPIAQRSSVTDGASSAQVEDSARRTSIVVTSLTERALRNRLEDLANTLAGVRSQISETEDEIRRKDRVSEPQTEIKHFDAAADWKLEVLRSHERQVEVQLNTINAKLANFKDQGGIEDSKVFVDVPELDNTPRTTSFSQRAFRKLQIFGERVTAATRRRRSGPPVAGDGEGTRGSDDQKTEPEEVETVHEKQPDKPIEPVEDHIYEEIDNNGVALQKKVSDQNQPWYFSALSKEDAEDRLIKPGDFLVRASKNPKQHAFALRISKDQVLSLVLPETEQGYISFDHELYPSISAFVKRFMESTPPIHPTTKAALSAVKPILTDSWMIYWKDITVGALLARGNHGSVNMAVYRNGPVIAKTIANNEDAQVRSVDSLLFFHQLKHENVVQFLGVVIGNPVYCVFEYCGQGSLHHVVSTNNTLTDDHFENMLIQVSRGMDYLSIKGVIHGNLCARQCMVSEQGIVKVSGYGATRVLAQTLLQSNYQHFLLSDRWLAPEVIRGSDHSFLSDLWSFGVLAWEVLTRGQQPFAACTSDESIASVVDQIALYLLFPTTTSPHLAVAASKCWNLTPEKRPSFGELTNLLVTSSIV